MRDDCSECDADWTGQGSGWRASFAAPRSVARRKGRKGVGRDPLRECSDPSAAERIAASDAGDRKPAGRPAHKQGAAVRHPRAVGASAVPGLRRPTVATRTERTHECLTHAGRSDTRSQCGARPVQQGRQPGPGLRRSVLRGREALPRNQGPAFRLAIAVRLLLRPAAPALGDWKRRDDLNSRGNRLYRRGAWDRRACRLQNGGYQPRQPVDLRS